MKIAFNPSTVAALIAPPNNKDITFDLRGQNIFARGVKFCGTDTNTWRDIKINNVSIDSNTLDLRDGDNTTLTNINGVVTINSTWRPVVDNLTSDSTTSSLTANQGRILKALIDGKSDSGHNHDDRYVKKTGDTMFGALNFANGTWNLVGDDSYIGDCNISGHFGIKAANTTYPGIAFFNNANDHLGNLTAYNGNIKYGAYSLQFLDNGNTSVSASTWMNPFSDYNSNAVADGQAICVWGQSSSLSNLAADSGDMSLWLKRVNANVATLNMVLDGEYYANGNQRLAHVSEIPNSLRNPYALTISLNGTSQGPYDGSAAKNINITPSSIGAATSGHNHDSSYVKYTKVTKSTADNTNATPYLYNVENEEVISGYYKYWYIFNMGQYSGGNFGTQIAMPYENSLTDSELFIRSANSGSWRTWRRILHSNNYASILDSRYYTESEIDSLLDAKLNRQNLSYGTWNPRGYNLAADYQYNGGDLSISESGGQIHVSVDGYFWQNEGQYRVLDTSDIGGIQGSITIQQYLSNSDTNWYPLIWGGNDHRNTYTSTGGIYKSHDVLSWQTSSQTLYATHLQTTYIDLQNNRGISQVTSEGTSPYKGIKLPNLQSNAIGIFSRVGNGSDEGGIVLSEDTCVIYNSFDTGWGLSVRDKDITQTDISGDNTIAFGIRQDYRAYSLGGFEKSGSNNSYVLLGGGDHKLESSLNVANADTVDGYHYDDFTYKRYIGYNRNGPYNIKVFSAHTSSLTWGAYYLIFDIFSSGYFNNRVYFGKYEVSLGHWNNTDKNPTVYSRWIFKTNSAYDCVHVIKDLSNYTVDVYIENNLWDCSMGLSIVAIDGFNMVSSSPWVNLPSASGTVQLIDTTYLSFMGNADLLDGYHASGLLTSITNSNNGISITVGGTTKSVSNISVNYASSAGNADTVDGYHASSLWRSDGATWNPSANVSLTASGNNQEWSFDIRRNGHTGCYWHVWDSTLSTLLKVNADNGKVYAPYNFVGNLEGNASTATALTTNAGNSINPVYFSGGKPIACTMSTGRGDGILRSFGRGAYTSANQYFGNGTIVAIDPIGTGCISANDTILSLGDTSNRNTQLLVAWDRDGVYYRRITDTTNYGSWKRLAFTTDNIDSATKLATARNIWGQSFNGTADVNGTIYINNSDSSNGAIRLNNNVNSNARISAISDKVIFNTGNAIRFGETAWDWNQWAGLKYNHSNKTIYLGIADGSIFNANSAQSGGTLNLRAGISNIDLNSGTSIRGLTTNGAPYSSSITLNDISISIGAYGSISMSTGPGAIELKSGQGVKASIGSDFKIEASRGVYLNSGNSGNVWLCQGGGNVGIGTTSPSYKLDVNGQMRASGFRHSDHSINDAVLLAGGGYERIFKLGTTRYYNNTSYELSFHKLSSLCNNLVWVDGCIWNSTSTSFYVSSDFYPYLYANSPSMRTIYRMDGNNMITVDGNGLVVISCSSYPRRIGFFYTGRA